MRNKIFTLFFGLLLTGSLMASHTLSPTLDISYRTNGTKSGWVSSTPKQSSDAQVFELRWSTQFFAIQQYEIPNYAKAKKMTLTLSLGAARANNDMAVWNFPYEMPENSQYDATKRGVFFSNVETATGGLFSSSEGSFANQLAVSKCSANTEGTGKWTFEINAAGLKPYGFKEDGTTAIIQLLVTTSTPGAATQAKYQSNNSSNDAANRPKLVVDYIDTYSNYPINDYNYRFNNSKGWNNDAFPKLSDANDKFELTYTARLYVVQQYVIEDFSPANAYTLTVTSYGNNNKDAYVWDFPYELPCKNAYPSSTIAGHIEIVTGTDLTAGTPSINTSYAIATTKTAASGSTYSFTIPGYKLTPVYVGDNRYVVTVLLTSTNNSHLYSGKASNGTNRSTLTKTTAKAYPIINTTQMRADETLADAVTNANANDVITLYDDVTISTSLSVGKILTFEGATGAEKITCGVASKDVMVYGNANPVTFRNVIVDGNNVERSAQLFDVNTNKKICLDGVSVINASYSAAAGDIKGSGGNVILKGNNTLPGGIYLNKNRRVEHTGATHTDPIKIVLADDYVQDYAIVLTCNNTSLYEAQTASGTAWELYVSNNQLKGRVMPAHTYDLTVSAAGMATLVLGFDAELPSGVKAYTLTNNGDANIWAEEVNQLTKNQPVLVVADADTYTFTSATGVALDEQADPSYGCLKGTYEEEINVPESAAGVYNYILKNGDAGVGFYKVPDSSCKIRRNRAYLSCGYNSVVASAPMRIRFKEDTATGVEQTVAQQSARKLIINGELFILRDEHLYRIDGRMVK